MLYCTLLLFIFSCSALHSCSMYHEGVQYYKLSQFDKALSSLQQATDIPSTDTFFYRSMTAQCNAAIAIKNSDHQRFDKAIAQFVAMEYHQGTSNQIVAIASEGFGDTIMFSYFLKERNNYLRHIGAPEIILHLKGNQSDLLPLLRRSEVATTILTDASPYNKDYSTMPLIGTVTAQALFTIDKEPYLIPDPIAINYWKKQLDSNRLNIVTKWCCGKKPVLGGRRLYRDLTLQTIIDIALAVDPNAQIYLVQGPNDFAFVTKSAYDKLSPEEQYLYRYDVIPDSYLNHVTIIPTTSNSKNAHGPFEDITALLSLCIYVGADTVTAHISAHVHGGQAITIIPTVNEDHTRGRDWRWTDSGEISIWYPQERFRLFECNIKNKAELKPIVTQLAQWHHKRKLQ